MIAEPGRRAQLRQDWSVSSPTILIGCLGRFNSDKDQHSFVQAGGLIAAGYPDVHFLLVGRGCAPDNAELVAWIAATGFSDRFHCIGQRADVPDVLACMDVFCLSSRTEGFPNVVAEAMAMGLPCLVTDVGDAAFLVGDTGRVVPPESPEALAAGMRELIAGGGAIRREMGARAMRRVKSEFNIQRARERFELVYNQVISKLEI
jgi:glycosyltransferase involved in cell wall biosynthesis